MSTRFTRFQSIRPRPNPIALWHPCRRLSDVKTRQEMFCKLGPSIPDCKVQNIEFQEWRSIESTIILHKSTCKILFPCFLSCHLLTSSQGFYTTNRINDSSFSARQRILALVSNRVITDWRSWEQASEESQTVKRPRYSLEKMFFFSLEAFL